MSIRSRAFDRLPRLYWEPDSPEAKQYLLYELLETINNQMGFTIKSGKYKGHYHKPGYWCLARFDPNVTRLYYYAPLDSDGQLTTTRRAAIKSFKLHDLLKIVYKHPKHQWYIYPNTYKTQSVQESRTNQRKHKDYTNVNTITSFYLDFDVYKNLRNRFDNNKQMMRVVRRGLPYVFNEAGVPFNAIINSGRGFHVLILLNKGVYAGTSDIVKAWSDVEKNIRDKVSRVCKQTWGKSPVDTQVVNINRTLRIAGSYNMKPDSEYPKDLSRFCHVDYLNIHNRPSMKELYEKFTGRKWTFGSGKSKRRKSYRLNHKSWTKANNKLIHHHNHHAGVSHRTLGHLHRSRCYDIQHLIRIRNHEHVLDGYRDEAMFLYACNMIMVHTVNYTRSMVKRLNGLFLKPDDKDLNKVLSELGTDQQPGKIYLKTRPVLKGVYVQDAYLFGNLYLCQYSELIL